MEKQRVLIVEDEGHVRRSVSLALTQGGYDVTEVGTGEQALEAIQSEVLEKPYHAVICDLALPRLSGQEVIAYLRGAKPTVPVIVLTARPDIQGAASLFRQGVADYLVKPAQAQVILETLRRILVPPA